MLGLSCGTRGLSCEVKASLQLWPVGSVVPACRLICPMACGILVSWLGTEPMSPALGRQILNHWTTRKVSVQRVLERTAASSNPDVIVYMNAHSPCFAAHVELHFSKL